MAQDKEKIKELTKRIKDLEGTLAQKSQNIQDYQDIEKIADEKIKGLNAIHAEKIRSLMNSIQMLKKENASMTKQGKEHKRSEFIQQLNKDIGDQDTVIGILRGLIPDQKKADAAIISTLSKGPARIRVPTREELNIEIKELKTKLLKYEKKKGQNTAAGEETKMAQMEEEQVSMISTKVAESRPNAGNAEYIMKINELNNEVEDLQLVVAGKQTEVEKYKQLISKKNEEIIELTQSKIDLKFMITKNEELKNEIEGLRTKLNSDLYTNYDQTIKLEELELAATIHKNLQNKSNEAIKLEIETLQNKMTEIVGHNKQLVLTNNKLKDESSSAKQLLEDAKERNRKLGSEHEQQVNRLQEIIKEKDAAMKGVNSKLSDYEGKFDGYVVEIKNKESMIGDLEAKITELEHQVEELANRSERVSSRHNLDSRNNLESSMLSSQVEAKKQELEKETNYLKQENFRLKERVKELTKTEIELSDKVDMLEQENRFLNRKVIAANLINKDAYSDTVRTGDMQTYLKEVATRYETRIKDLTAKINELEARNKDLEDIHQIMNSKTGSLNSLQGRSNSIALTESEQL